MHVKLLVVKSRDTIGLKFVLDLRAVLGINRCGGALCVNIMALLPSPWSAAKINSQYNGLGIVP